MTEYKGIINEHHTVQSTDKGTPGIEFVVELHESKNGDDWFSIAKREVKVSIWFPSGGDTSYSMKKLALCGFHGGSLSDMNLTGNTCLLNSEMRPYKGKHYEQFEFALPLRSSPKASDAAFLAIDAVLQASKVEQVELPEPINEAKPAPMMQAKPAPVEAPALPLDDEVPF